MIGSSNSSTTVVVLLGNLCCSMASLEICPINRIILAFPTFVQLNKVKVRAVLPYAMCYNSHISCVLVILCSVSQQTAQPVEGTILLNFAYTCRWLSWESLLFSVRIGFCFVEIWHNFRHRYWRDSHDIHSILSMRKELIEFHILYILTLKEERRF